MSPKKAGRRTFTSKHAVLLVAGFVSDGIVVNDTAKECINVACNIFEALTITYYCVSKYGCILPSVPRVYAGVLVEGEAGVESAVIGEERFVSSGLTAASGRGIAMD
jgi:hypothetical protein